MTPRSHHLALLLIAILPAAARAQSVQYTSPAGITYRSQADTGPIARAQRAVDADPLNVQKLITLGIAQAGARQMQEAVRTFTRALAIAPNNPILYRWRGHRNLSVRNFDQAMADLTRGYGMDSTVYGILYHLGVLRFVRGDFNAAADAFRRAQPLAPDAGELAGSTDWRWMSLMRAGRASRGGGDARAPPRFTADDRGVRAAAEALSRRDRPEQCSRRATPATWTSRRSRTGSGTGTWSRRHDAGARAFRALGRVGRMAGVRVHRVGGGAEAVAVSARYRTVNSCTIPCAMCGAWSFASGRKQSIA